MRKITGSFLQVWGMTESGNTSDSGENIKCRGGGGREPGLGCTGVINQDYGAASRPLLASFSGPGMARLRAGQLAAAAGPAASIYPCALQLPGAITHLLILTLHNSPEHWVSSSPAYKELGGTRLMRRAGTSTAEVGWSTACLPQHLSHLI